MAQDNIVSTQTNGQTKNFAEHCRMPGVCVTTRNMFKNDRCIGKERASKKEQAKDEATAKQESTKPDHNRRTKTKSEHKRQRKVTKSTNINNPVAHRNGLSI